MADKLVAVLIAQAMTDFLSKHPSLAVLIVSGFQFEIGRTYLRMGKRTTGLSWQLLGLTCALLYTIGAVVMGNWTGSALVLAIAVTEVVLLRRAVGRPGVRK